MTLVQFDKFERRNPKYAIYVYAYDDDGFYTLRVCDQYTSTMLRLKTSTDSWGRKWLNMNMHMSSVIDILATSKQRLLTIPCG